MNTILSSGNMIRIPDVGTPGPQTLGVRKPLAVTGPRPIAPFGSAAQDNTGFVSSESFQDLSVLVNTSNNINTSGFINPLLAEDLKRIAFFDLMKTAPRINQLFNPDFKNLIKSLVEIQNNQKIGLKEDLKNVNHFNLHQGNISTSDALIFSESFNKMSDNSFAMQGGAAIDQTNESSQMNAYNHLLHASQNSGPVYEQSNARYNHKSKQNFDQKHEPYFDKKKKQKGNIRQSAVDSLIKLLANKLDKLSKNLSDLVE